jgi:hypothetical protein
MMPPSGHVRTRWRPSAAGSGFAGAAIWWRGKAWRRTKRRCRSFTARRARRSAVATPASARRARGHQCCCPAARARTLDVVSDTLFLSRPVCILCMGDNHTRESLSLVVDTLRSDVVPLSLLGAWTARRVALLRTERAYAKRHGRRLRRRLRDECLGDRPPASTVHVCFVCHVWRRDYNHVRPQSKLGPKMSAEIAQPIHLAD